VNLEGLEPPTFWSVARCSIQLSYRSYLLSSGPQPSRHLYVGTIKLQVLLYADANITKFRKNSYRKETKVWIA
jgi:hypothetical protein